MIKRIMVRERTLLWCKVKITLKKVVNGLMHYQIFKTMKKVIAKYIILEKINKYLRKIIK